MTNKMKVEGFSDLVKDKYSGAILNCNREAYLSAKSKREAFGKITKLEEEVKSLKTTNEEIKNMLKTLLERTNP